MNRLQSSSVLLVCALLLLGAFAASSKLAAFGTTRSGDFETYVQTATYLKGEPVSPSTPMIIPQRLLKPLAPLLVAGLSTLMSYESALLTQSLVFYAALIVMLFLFSYEFFRGRRLAVFFVLLSAFSYPVLKYGIDVYTETGALFFYVLSLWLTLKFARHPTLTLCAANIAAVTIGCLWKEYSVVAGAIFGLVLLFHDGLSWRRKSAYIAMYAGMFLACTVPIQIYVLRVFDFSFLTWYRVGAGSGFESEFNVKNIVKSTAALIGLAWLLVPAGLSGIRDLESSQRRFLYVALTVPFIGYAWGYVSSRLLYVLAVPFLLVAIMGMRRWSRTAQLVFVVLAMTANIAWLFMSYRITL